MMIRRWAALLGFVGTRSGLGHVALVAASGLGAASLSCRGGFALSWWAATLALWLVGWFLLAGLVSLSPEEARLRARQLAVCAAPLALFALYPLWAVAPLPDSLQLLVGSLATGGTVALALGTWVLPHLGPLPRPLSRIVASGWTVWLIALAWAGVYAVATIMTWWRFGQHSQDMAIYEQAVYNTLHGRFLEYSTDLRFAAVHLSRFADHFEPIVLGFVPLYLLWPTPVWFLLAQAVCPALGAVAVARIAARWCASASAGLVLAALYLLFPGLHLAMWVEFHPSTLAVAGVLWGLWWGLQGRAVPSLIALVLAMACKENVPGTVAMVGLFLAWKGQRRLGLAVALLAVVWFLVAIEVIVPHFSPTGASFYTGLVSEPFRSVTATPSGIWVYIARRSSYLCSVVGSVGGLCLLCPTAFALSLPELAFNLSSHNLGMGLMMRHYHVLTAVGTVLGAAGGMAWLRNRLAARVRLDAGARRVIHRGLLVGLVVASLRFLGAQDQLLTDLKPEWFARRNAEQHELARLLRQIPEGAPVLTNDGGLSSHLARRRLQVFHLCPDRVVAEVLAECDQVDYVALSIAPNAAGNLEPLVRKYHLRLLGRTEKYRLYRTARSPDAPARPATSGTGASPGGRSAPARRWRAGPRTESG